MAKRPSKTKKAKAVEIELVPDAWPRFEKFIREIVKAGPQHRSSQSKKPVRATAGGRRRKPKYDKDGRLIRATAY
jgi:hypothetical protein